MAPASARAGRQAMGDIRSPGVAGVVHTGRMGRTVSAVVTWGDAYLGVIGPFAVSVPWWSEVEPVVAHLREMLDVPVLVLRLLLVEGGEGGRDGHVTYHVAALRRPAPGLLAGRPADQAALTGPEGLRSPWARLEGISEVLSWAADTLGAAGRRVTGPAVQRKTWNLAALFRLPTVKGPVWLKTTPCFAADEASVIAAFARVDPALVPPVIGAGPRRILLGHLPGQDCWDASPTIITSAVRRLAAAQAVLASQPASLPPGLPDRRAPVIAGQIRALLDSQAGGELSAGETAAARGLLSRFALLDDCGLPDTIVHGDFHPGNWRSDGGPRPSWTGPTLISATRCWTGCGPVISCPRAGGPSRPGPGSTPGHRASPGASPPARCASPDRLLTSCTRCATRNSSTASSHQKGSTISAIPQLLSVPHCTAHRNRDNRTARHRRATGRNAVLRTSQGPRRRNRSSTGDHWRACSARRWLQSVTRLLTRLGAERRVCAACTRRAGRC